MKKIIITFNIICFNLFLSCAQQEYISSEIKENIKARVDSGDNISIVVGYFDGDDIEYFSYGKTRNKNGENVDENTVFEIGSISKVFTTILLANKIITGEMKLSDPITKYLPKYVKVYKKKNREITLRDLATHSSGLPRMPDNIFPSNPNNPFADYTKELLYSFLSTHKLSRDIGERFEYSNVGIGLLGHILELQSNKSLETLITEKITTTYNMNSTGIVLTNEMKENLAYGHSRGRKVENWDLGILAGAGGIRSTVKDMVTFLQANILENEQPLKSAMTLSHKVAYKNKKGFKMGLGWLYMKGGSIIWHNGSTGGYTSFVGFLKGSTKGVVVLTNTGRVSVDDIGKKLLSGK